MTPSNNLNLLCFPTVKVTNRQQKRKVLKELKSNNEYLAKIEASFYDEIFNSVREYRDIYIDYLNKWNEAIQFLKAEKRLKYTAVNVHLFQNYFRPIEKPFELSFRFARPRSNE